MGKESPIFVHVHETVVWLVRHTRKFPRDQRFVTANRLTDAAFGLHDALSAGARSRDPRQHLAQADTDLARLRWLNRVCKDLELECHSMAQYEYLATRLEETGRLLGGWIRSIKGSRA